MGHPRKPFMVSPFTRNSNVVAVLSCCSWCLSGLVLLHAGLSHSSLPALKWKSSNYIQSLINWWRVSQHNIRARSVTQLIINRQIVKKTTPPSNFTGRGNNEMCLDAIQASVLRPWNKPEHIKRSLQTVWTTTCRRPARLPADTNYKVNTPKNIPLKQSFRHLQRWVLCSLK